MVESILGSEFMYSKEYINDVTSHYLKNKPHYNLINKGTPLNENFYFGFAFLDKDKTEILILCDGKGDAYIKKDLSYYKPKPNITECEKLERNEYTFIRCIRTFDY